MNIFISQALDSYSEKKYIRNNEVLASVVDQ